MRGRSNALIAVLHAVGDRIVYSVDVGSQEVRFDAKLRHRGGHPPEGLSGYRSIEDISG